MCIRDKPGTAFDADLVYFPGTNRLRAFIHKMHTAPRPVTAIHAESLPDALERYARALANNPWLGPFPFILAALYPTRIGGLLLLRDAAGVSLPLDSAFSHRWPLLALSGDRPLDVAGEWNGRGFWPTGVCVDGRFVDMNQIGSW